MKKIYESIMYLYKGYIAEEKAKKFIPDYDALKYGVLIDNDCDENIKKMAIELWGKDGYILNQTFHKSLNTVIKSSDEKLIIEQIIHYFTTYGYEELGIYSNDTVYIPYEVLEISEVSENIKLIVISPIAKAELKEKLWNLVTSSIPLSSKVLEHIIILSDYLEVNKENIDKIKNREVKIALYDKLDIVPNNNVEFLRYLIYRLTNKTLLIKDLETVNALKRADKSVALMLLNKYKDQYGLIYLANIFNRFKPLFLSLKTSKYIIKNKDGVEFLEYIRLKSYEIQLNSLINKISKLSKKNHLPFIVNDLDRFIVWYKENYKKDNYLDLFNEKLENETIWRIIKLRNYVYMVNNNINEKVYKIRNGKVWVTNKSQNVLFEKEVLDVLDNIIVGRLKNNVFKKNVYLDNNVDLVIPQSEKQFVGNIPFSSSIEIEKDNLLIGIHWYNLKDSRVDLDLKIISSDYSIGWDANYKAGDKLVFTGDVTDAPYPFGASEYVYVDRSINNTIFSLKVNNFTRNLDDIEYDIIVAKKSKKKLKKNYIVDTDDIIIKIPKNLIEKNKAEHSLGNVIVNDNRIIISFTDLSTSNRRTSSESNFEQILRTYIQKEAFLKCKLEDYLKMAGAIITNNKDDVDIDLSIESLNKNTIIDLFK